MRITGDFSMVRTRTVTEQHKPYRPFTEATQDQQEVTFTDVSGTLAGFRMPEFEQGISVAGYHSHFIDKDHDRGGHALDYRLARGRVEISVRSRVASEFATDAGVPARRSVRRGHRTHRSARPREADMTDNAVRSAQRVVETLSAYGIQYVFGVPRSED